MGIVCSSDGLGSKYFALSDEKQRSVKCGLNFLLNRRNVSMRMSFKEIFINFRLLVTEFIGR